MSFLFKCIIIVGAMSGIGLAFAELFVVEGHEMIVLGRQERLDAFIQKHGSTKTALIAYKISEVVGLPKFVGTVMFASSRSGCRRHGASCTMRTCQIAARLACRQMSSRAKRTRESLQERPCGRGQHWP